MERVIDRRFAPATWRTWGFSSGSRGGQIESDDPPGVLTVDLAFHRFRQIDAADLPVALDGRGVIEIAIVGLEVAAGRREESLFFLGAGGVLPSEPKNNGSGSALTPRSLP